MKRIRVLSLVVFILAAGLFGAYRFRQIKQTDHTGPRIHMDKKEIQVPSNGGEEELLKGVTAEDAKDGDVTDSLIVESMTNFLEKGRRRITIAAFDADNHVTKATREIVYTDYESPRFQLSGALEFPEATTEFLRNLTVQDMLDGDLTGYIKLSEDSAVKEDQEGDYPVVFSVSNSAGDVAKLPATIRIYDPSGESKRPKIHLSEFLIYVEKGTEVNPWDYVEKITIKGNDFEKSPEDTEGALVDMTPSESQEKTVIEADEVTVSGDLDTGVPGSYELTYRITDENHETGTSRLLVVVTE